MDADWPRHPKEWQKTKLLGHGTYAAVLELQKVAKKHRPTDKFYALKIILNEDPQIETEREILTLLGSTSLYTVPFYGAYSTRYNNKWRKCFLFAKMDNLYTDTIASYHMSRNHAPETEYMHSLTETLLKGLQSIHEKGIAHRDIKPDNLFIAGTNVEKPRVIYSDFGLSCFMREEGSCDRQRGTVGYLSPQVCFSYLKRQPLSQEELIDADLFALGATLYYAIYMMPPYQWILNNHRHATENKEDTTVLLRTIFAEYTGVIQPIYHCPKIDEIIGNLVDPIASNRKSIVALLEILKL